MKNRFQKMLQWPWSRDNDRAIRVTDEFAENFCKSKDVQSVLGRLNHFAQMHIFGNGVRFRSVQIAAEIRERMRKPAS
jgi:hypothetical protein